MVTAEVSLECIARQNEGAIERLGRIDGRLEELGEDMRGVKGRVSALEAQHASSSLRVDRFDARLRRIEQRLDLVDEPA